LCAVRQAHLIIHMSALAREGIVRDAAIIVPSQLREPRALQVVAVRLPHAV